MRYYRELFDEISSGRTKYLPSTFATLATQFYGISGSALLAGGAVLAFGAGLGYLAYEAVAAEHELMRIKTAADFSGNLQISSSVIQNVIDQLDRLPGVSRKDAGETANALAQIKNIGSDTFQGLAAAIAEYSTATGTKLDDARKVMLKAFTDPIRQVVPFLDTLHGVTQAQYDGAQAAVQSGNMHKAASVMLDALANSFRQINPEIERNSTGVFSSWKNFLLYASGLYAGFSPQQIQADILKKQAKNWNDLADSIAKAAQAEANKPLTSEQKLHLGVEASDEEDMVAVADRRETQCGSASGSAP